MNFRLRVCLSGERQLDAHPCTRAIIGKALVGRAMVVRTPEGIHRLHCTSSDGYTVVRLDKTTSVCHPHHLIAQTEMPDGAKSSVGDLSHIRSC